MALAVREFTNWLAEKETEAAEVDPRLRSRLHLAACCLLLTVLAFVTRPGNIIADTKIDMALNPLGFLQRALHLWDPEQFGQLQNQVAGYFFPMGPFFAVGRMMGLSPWVVQRLWLSTLMIVAFIGVVKLARRLDLGSPTAQIAGGLAYALSPRALSLLGQLSSEALPAAMLPWIVLPLITGLCGGSRIKAAVRSAVAVALCSGINAAATFALLIVPAILLVTAARGTHRWRLLGWWSGATVLATLSWTVPLLLQQKYAFSFLTYTETADVTTATTSISNTLRGTEDWVNYLVVNGQPWLAVSHALATQPVITMLTGVVAGGGVAGLLRRDLPARRFLLCCLIAGLALIGAGHISAVHAPFAGAVRDLVNGPLAPLRNLRKFDPVVRLPICLGLIHLLSSVRRPDLRRGVQYVALAVVAGVAVPGFVNGLSATGDFQQVPPYWTQATGWLNSHAGQQAVLAVPGTRFGEYLWGRPMDDIMEPLSTIRWGGRLVAATGSVGYTRLLAAIDQRLAAGDGSPGLAQLLARMDVKYVLVRNDLARDELDGAWPARIHQALAASPGITEVAQFGPPVGINLPNDAVSTFDPQYPALEVYQVSGADPVVTVVPTSQVVRVTGGPESLLTLADAGLLGKRPVLLNGDSGAAEPSTPLVATDSLPLRSRDFSQLRSNYTATLSALSRSSPSVAQDLTQPSWSRDVAVAQYYGIRNVTASSSGSDVTAIPQDSATAYLPYAAVDGDYRTGWQTGGYTGPIGQWIRLNLLHPVDTNTIQVAFGDSTTLGPPVSLVAVETAHGSFEQRVAATGSPQTLRVPPGPTTWLRIRILGLAYRPATMLGVRASISEIFIPGVQATRSIRLPTVRGPGATDPGTIAMSLGEPQPNSCMPTPLRWECSPQLSRSTEEQFTFDRTFSLAAAHTAQLTGTATITDPGLVSKYTRFGADDPQVSGSSSQTDDPQQLPLAAFDGRPATTWVAKSGDIQPTLTIQWGHMLTIGNLTIQQPPGASGPLQVLLTGSRGQPRSGFLDPTGTFRFRPIRTDRITLTFSPATLPLQISEVKIPGVQQLATPDSTPFRLPCGFGPQLLVDGSSVQTSVSGTFSDVFYGRPLQYSSCSSVSLSQGDNRLTESGLDGFHLSTAILALQGGGALTANPAPATGSALAYVPNWKPGQWNALVAASQQSYLVVGENYNPGWHATLGGKTLQPVRLDGWKQAWIVPAGTYSLVTVTYQPDVFYRAALFGGLFIVVVFIVLALLLSKRRATARPVDEALGARRELRVPAVAACAASAALGMWLAGFVGAAVMLGSTAGFLVAIRRAASGGGWRSRAASSPALVVAFLAVAAAIEVYGLDLRNSLAMPAAVSAFYDIGPQLICMVVLGRVMAAFASRPKKEPAAPPPAPPELAPALPEPARPGSGAGPAG